MRALKNIQKNNFESNELKKMIILDQAKKTPLKDCMFNVKSFVDGTKYVEWILPLNKELVNDTRLFWVSYGDLLKMENFKYKVSNGKYNDSNRVKPKYIKCRLAKTLIKKIEESRNI